MLTNAGFEQYDGYWEKTVPFSDLNDTIESIRPRMAGYTLAVLIGFEGRLGCHFSAPTLTTELIPKHPDNIVPDYQGVLSRLAQ